MSGTNYALDEEKQVICGPAGKRRLLTNPDTGEVKSFFYRKPRKKIDKLRHRLPYRYINNCGYPAAIAPEIRSRN